MAEGCIKDETKQKCQKVVFGISIVLFIIAVLLIGFAAASYGGVKKITKGGYESPFEFKQD